MIIREYNDNERCFPSSFYAQEVLLIEDVLERLHSLDIESKTSRVRDYLSRIGVFKPWEYDKRLSSLIEEGGLGIHEKELWVTNKLSQYMLVKNGITVKEILGIPFIKSKTGKPLKECTLRSYLDLGAY